MNTNFVCVESGVSDRGREKSPIGRDLCEREQLQSELDHKPPIRRVNMCVKSAPNVNVIGDNNFYMNIVNDYGLAGDSFADLSPSHGVEHHVVTIGPPVFAKARRLDAEKLEIAKKEFLSMEKAGICRRSSSPWASPLHMVPKPNSSYRPCGDYRRLNMQTVPNRYPLPSINDVLINLAGFKVFSNIDLLKGYLQVPMHPDDIEKTAIITPFGAWEFLKMPFGMKNAASTGQIVFWSN